jgi:hypothetical protein
MESANLLDAETLASTCCPPRSDVAIEMHELKDMVRFFGMVKECLGNSLLHSQDLIEQAHNVSSQEAAVLELAGVPATVIIPEDANLSMRGLLPAHQATLAFLKPRLEPGTTRSCGHSVDAARASSVSITVSCYLQRDNYCIAENVDLEWEHSDTVGDVLRIVKRLVQKIEPKDLVDVHVIGVSHAVKYLDSSTRLGSLLDGEAQLYVTNPGCIPDY